MKFVQPNRCGILSLLCVLIFSLRVCPYAISVKCHDNGMKYGKIFGTEMDV